MAGNSMQYEKLLTGIGATIVQAQVGARSHHQLATVVGTASAFILPAVVVRIQENILRVLIPADALGTGLLVTVERESPTQMIARVIQIRTIRGLRSQDVEGQRHDEDTLVGETEGDAVGTARKTMMIRTTVASLRENNVTREQLGANAVILEGPAFPQCIDTMIVMHLSNIVDDRLVVCGVGVSSSYKTET